MNERLDLVNVQASLLFNREFFGLACLSVFHPDKAIVEISSHVDETLVRVHGSLELEIAIRPEQITFGIEYANFVFADLNPLTFKAYMI